MSFAYRQGNSTHLSAVSLVSVVLGSTPIVGNLVCVSIWANGVTGLTMNSVKDGNNNSYTVTPNSPSNANEATKGDLFLAWWLVSGTPSATITATFSAQINHTGIIADEFTITGGPPTFDKDIAGIGSSGTVINTPTISPTNASSLCYAAGSAATNIDTAGSFTPWTQGTDETFYGSASEYILSTGSATAVNIPMTSTGGAWTAMAMAFFLGAGGAVQPIYQDDSPTFSTVAIPDSVITVW